MNNWYKLVCLLALPILVSSCARLLNSEQQYVTVYTDVPSQIRYDRDTIHTIDNEALVKLPRQRDALRIEVETDSLTKSVDIYTSSSFMYWSNIYLNYGIGMLADMKNPKRYALPEHVFLDTSDTLNTYSIFGETNNKGKIFFHAGLPFAHHILNDIGWSKMGSFSMLGLSVGVSYYYSRNRFLNFGYTYLSPLFPIDVAGGPLDTDPERLDSYYLFLANTIKKNRLSYGYGVSYAFNATYSIQRYNTLGIILSTHYQLGEYLHVGLVYKPTYFNLDESHEEFKTGYEHSISLEFAYRVRVDY